MYWGAQDTDAIFCEHLQQIESVMGKEIQNLVTEKSENIESFTHASLIKLDTTVESSLAAKCQQNSIRTLRLDHLVDLFFDLMLK